jgi:hypothetical protein
MNVASNSAAHTTCQQGQTAVAQRATGRGSAKCPYEGIAIIEDVYHLFSLTVNDSYVDKVRGHGKESANY